MQNSKRILLTGTLGLTIGLGKLCYVNYENDVEVLLPMHKRYWQEIDGITFYM